MTDEQASREDTSQRALGQRHSAWPRAVAGAMAVFPRVARAIKGFFDLEPVRPGQHYPPVRLPSQRTEATPAQVALAQATPAQAVPPEAASSALDRKQTDA